jgi:hypothetical protein
VPEQAQFTSKMASSGFAELSSYLPAFFTFLFVEEHHSGKNNPKNGILKKREMAKTPKAVFFYTNCHHICAQFICSNSNVYLYIAMSI